MRGLLAMTIVLVCLLPSFVRAAKLCKEGTSASASGTIEEIDGSGEEWWILPSPQKTVSDCVFQIIYLQDGLPTGCAAGRKFKAKGTISSDPNKPEAAFLVRLTEFSCH